MLLLLIVAAWLPGGAVAQTSPALPSPPPTEVLPPAHGQILIQSHGEPPTNDVAPATPGATSLVAPAEDAKADVSDAERGALTFTSYDLDARLTPARAGLAMRARVTVRNDGAAPLRVLALQISSTLRWESATLVHGAERLPLTLAQHRLDTDADHTGTASEAVLPLPQPLAPGASVSLDLFYAGTLQASVGRLQRLGASAAQGQAADWDGIGATWTGLRGFGNVLWYPVAAPQMFLADGNGLFTSIGRTRLREQTASVRLRLSVNYVGEPPAAAYFCGRRAALHAVPDDPDAPTATAAGVATAEFAPETLGFRVPSLFVLEQPEVLLGGGENAGAQASSGGGAFSSSSQEVAGGTENSAGTAEPNAAGVGPLVALATGDPGVGPGLATAAARASALLSEWLGPRPLSALTVLDHDGQPFQDGPLLVAPAASLETSPEAPALVYSLTHAWVQTGQPWMDEGLAQFFALLSVERASGRAAALAQLDELLRPVAFAEPPRASAAGPESGQPLIAAPDELFYRRKAAAVWWMLRDLAGDGPLRAALEAWRTQPASHTPAAEQAVAFEHLLEHLSGKDLDAFFADWVLHDHGLPDLSITAVETSQAPASPGHSSAWLVAVTVRNEGGALADVPLVVHSAQLAVTERIRVPAFSATTQRVLIESAPTDVAVNDGSTPELRTSVHTRSLTVRSTGQSP